MVKLCKQLFVNETVWGMKKMFSSWFFSCDFFHAFGNYYHTTDKGKTIYLGDEELCDGLANCPGFISPLPSSSSDRLQQPHDPNELEKCMEDKEKFLKKRQLRFLKK